MTHHKVNSSIVSKGAMNSYDEMFPLAKMFSLAVIHMGYPKLVTQIDIGMSGYIQIMTSPPKKHYVQFSACFCSAPQQLSFG